VWFPPVGGEGAGQIMLVHVVLVVYYVR